MITHRDNGVIQDINSSGRITLEPPYTLYTRRATGPVSLNIAISESCTYCA